MFSNRLSAKSLNNSKRFFTPIVASSLALFLSAGIANAATTALTCPTSGADAPQVCYNYDGSSGTFKDANLSGLSWNPASGGNNVVTPQANNSDNIAILVFNFNNRTGSSNSTPSGSFSGNTYTVISGSIDEQVIVLDSGGKSIEMAKQTGGLFNGRLTVNFGEGNDSQREFHLNLSQATGDFSFKGDIAITAGKGATLSPSQNSTFYGNFGANVLGSITITNNTQQLNHVGHRTKLTFGDGASLIAPEVGGSKDALTTKAGVTTATFADGNIIGNVTAHAQGNGSPASNFITFRGEGNQIEGNILASTANAYAPTTAQNVIDFEQGGSIKGNIDAKGGKNTINFNGTSGRIEGNISVGSGKNGKAGQNTITASQNLTLKADEISVVLNKPNSTVNGNTFTVTETANITAGTIKATYGKNIFTAKDLTLKADSIETNGTRNNVSLTQNNFTASEQANITAGTITALSGINTFMLQGQDNTMTIGTLSSEKGLNTITLQSGTITATTIRAGGIDDQGALFGGVNNITLNNGSITVTTLEAKTGFNKIKLENGATLNANTIKVTGKSGGTNLEDGNNLIDILGDSKLSVGTLIATQGSTDKNGANVFAFRENGEITIKEGYSSSNGGKNLIASVVVGSNAGGQSTPTEGLQLLLEDKQVGGKTLLEAYGESFKQNNNNSLLKVEVKRDTAGSAAHSLTLTGLASGSIGKINTALENTTTIILANNSAFAGTMDLGKANLVLQQGGKFLVEDDTQTLKNVAFSVERFSGVLSDDALTHPNATIDLGALRDDSKPTEFKLLTIGDSAGGNKGLSGSDGLFRVSVKQDSIAPVGHKLGGQIAASDSDTYGYAYSDRVLVHEGTKGTHYIQAILEEGTDITKIGYKGGGTDIEGNIAVATIKTDTGITMEGAKQLVGYDVVGTILDSTATDDKGKANGAGTSKDYTTYFIKSMDNQGASKANQLSAITALSNNYMLYLANLNSLNKRMGELRENNASQGAWLRIFNGMQSTNFKEMLDSRAIYTTIQAGYDYTFGFKGASNYLGFALSYANALGSSESFRDINGIDKGLKNMNSNAFEFAIYNAYVQDGASKATGFKNGLYSDSIAKFSYILGSYNFLDQSNKTYDTSNFAFTLSQELGYRFLLGNDREFYIDPQAELAFGFFSNSNLAQSMGNNFFLKAMQDSILTLRSRVGSSFGYKFDKFTQNKGFNSSLYLGTYFVSDVILGGEVSINTNANKPLEIKPLTSDMRFVLNLGTNFKIKDNTRIYFDFERSFGGKITTDYQLNLGVRYSFGTSKYTPYTEANTQEIKDSNTLKEVEPTKGYYIELLEKEDKKLTNKELKTLQNLKEELRIQTKTQNNKTLKTYLAGPFKDEKKAKEAKTKLEGVIKELKGKGSIVEVE